MKQQRVARTKTIAVSVLTAVVCLLMAVQVNAQNAAKKITGKVISQASGAAVSGASVHVKGKTTTVVTDEQGNFTINAATGETLEISFVGMTKRSLVVGASNTVNASLTEDLSRLQDVVVVGYGRMKKSDLSSAVVTISSAEIERTVNTTLDQALQGKSPNVYVSQSSGAPGAGASVIIRGVSTVTGSSQPLYVIDGVQIRPSMSRGGAYQTGSGSASNELAGLNPEDIESMSVLMGPAATSIYGAAGANGVLVITTKQGRAGTTKVNVTSAQTLQTRPSELPVMNLQEWAAYRLKMQNYGLVGFNPPEIMDPSILGAGTNWQKELFRNTLMQKHSLSLSGGSRSRPSMFLETTFLKRALL